MRNTVASLALLGLAMFAAPAAQAATPASSVTTAPNTTIDTRPCWDTLASPLASRVDTRLYLLIHSPMPWAKIDTLTNPGTILIVR